MTWNYTFQPRFHADLKRLDQAVAVRILKTLERIQQDPLRTMKRLKGTDLFSRRVGDYRIYAKAYPGNRLIEFLRAGHRRSVHHRSNE